MSWRETVKFIPILFCTITTAQVIYMVVIVHAILGHAVEVDTIVLLSRFLIIAILTSLPTLVLIRDKRASRQEIIIRRAIHLVLTMLILVGLLLYYGWFELSYIWIAAVFLAIYLSAFKFWYSRSNHTALLINKRIHQIQTFENYENKNNENK